MLAIQKCYPTCRILYQIRLTTHFGEGIKSDVGLYCHVYGLCVTVKTGFRLDVSIYCT
jgi:hypothetical protein